MHFTRSKATAKILAICLVAIAVCAILASCTFGHKHSFDIQLSEERYLKASATCEKSAQYYYSCSCGEIGEEFFEYGEPSDHDYSAEIEEKEHEKVPADCQQPGEYYVCCSMCAKNSTDKTFTGTKLGSHKFSGENTDSKFLKTEETFETNAEYYKSCVCGEIGEETFFAGGIRSKERPANAPLSLTITLYDTKNYIYGFTFNMRQRLEDPVIQVSAGYELSSDCKEYIPIITEETSSDENDEQFTYYVAKTQIDLSGSVYTYRIYDKKEQLGTLPQTITLGTPNATSFSFAHVSDSQDSNGSGAYFARTLSNIVGNNDFILHTGDVVEKAWYEHEWDAMLHDNAEYLSQIPIMAISGNHESHNTTRNSTYEHFYNNIPAQDSVEWGYFYSFVYGNVKFIMLNTNNLSGGKLRADQYEWLVNELKNNTCTWTIVAMHNPMYSVGKYGSDPERNSTALALQTQLKGIFAQYGVDVVLQGHDHAVSRTYPIDETGKVSIESWQVIDGIKYSVDPDGVIYVMDGPAGAQARGVYDGYDESLYEYAGGSFACSWSEFDISGNTMTVRVMYDNGSGPQEYYSWGIIKS